MAGGTDEHSAFEGVRILDLTWVRAGPWATRILATLGADVIKVEWPAPGSAYLNDRLSTLGQPEDHEPSLNNSLWFSEKNAGKRSVTLNARHPTGLEWMRRLVAISDVVIENFTTGAMESWGLGYEELRAIRPDIIYVSLSALGHTGPDRGFRTYGPSAQALAGLTYLSGLPGEPPAGWGWSYLDDTGGMLGAAFVLAALHHRTRTGRGQHVDVSQVGNGIPLAGAALLDASVNGRPARREGFPPGNRSVWPGAPLLHNYRGRIAAPHNAYRTAGGGYNDWCAIACETDEEWSRLVEVMGSPAWAVDEHLATLDGRLEHQEALDEGIGRWTATLDKYELATRCQAAGVAAMPVQSNEDRVERDPQLAARGALTELPHPELGPMRYQNLPFASDGLAREPRAAAPLIGEHNVEVFGALLGLGAEELAAAYRDGVLWPERVEMPKSLRAQVETLEASTTETPRAGQRLVNRAATASAAASGSASGGPLEGLRVIEISGEPARWCGRLLADLGAEVVLIEPPGGSAEREVGPFHHDEPHPDRSLSFWHYHAGKRSLTLDLDAPEGQALLARLAEGADVLLEALPPGHLAERSLGAEALRARNPRLIICSLTPFGQTGPWRDYRTTDLVQLAAGGQMASCGYDAEGWPDAPPIAPGGGNAWHIGSHYALLAIMAALVQRDASGEGQHLDVSIHEACSLTTEAAVTVYLGTGRTMRRQTGRHASWSVDVPQTQYQTADGSYVNAMFNMRLTPERLREYAEWMDEHGAAEDLLDERYADPQTVLESQEHIVEVLRRFFGRITAEEAYRSAQARGQAWGAVRTVDDILADPHWRERGLLVDVEHEDLGESFTYAGPIARWTDSPMALRRRAPFAGEHTAEVLDELGVDEQELGRLRDAGAV